MTRDYLFGNKRVSGWKEEKDGQPGYGISGVPIGGWIHEKQFKQTLNYFSDERQAVLYSIEKALIDIDKLVKSRETSMVITDLKNARHHLLEMQENHPVIIKLSDEFIDFIDNGTKTSTVRFNKRIVDSDLIIFDSGSRQRNTRFVSPVIYKKYSELTQEDAIKDGFKSLEELQTVLKRFYPEINQDSDISIINFEKIK
jgi:ASC-1-like (ASCH) protein